MNCILKSSNNLYFLPLVFFILFSGGCGRSLSLGEDGLMYKGRRPYTGEIEDRYSVFDPSMERHYYRGVLVLELHLDRDGDSSYLALYNRSGVLRMEKTWNQGLIQRITSFDDYGRMRSEKRFDLFGALEKRSEFDYDPLGSVSVQREFDSRDRLSFHSEFSGDRQILSVKHYSEGVLTREIVHEKQALKREDRYENGRLLRSERFNDRGHPEELQYFGRDGQVEKFYRFEYNYSRGGALKTVTVTDSEGRRSSHSRIPDL